MLEELGNGVEGSAATSLKQNNAQKNWDVVGQRCHFVHLSFLT